MKLRWTMRARGDLIAIARYIAHDDPTAALSWITRLRTQARKTTQRPLAGRVVPEIGRADIREVLLGNYRIVYRVLPKTVHVLTVFEGHRILRLDEVEES